MGWYNYYLLLDKYEGDLSKATEFELKAAANANPDDPKSALALAEEKYRENRLAELKKSLNHNNRLKAIEIRSGEESC